MRQLRSASVLGLIAGVCLTVLCGFSVAAVNSPLPRPVPNWQIELVAQAPDVKHPSVVCAAPDGRVFVAEDPMDISAPANAALGRILCFHPDGRRSVFAEQLYAVFGMQFLEGKLYVLHNPKFSVFDASGPVGSNRVDLIESTNPNPWALDWNDHVPANFRLAMDGYLYVAVGDKGIYGAKGRDGKSVNLHGGGILRLRPEATELEVYCTGVRNILDVALNAEDEIFTYDNTDENHWMGRLTHMVDGGFYGYPYDFVPRRPYTLWMMADYGGGAATGALAYEEDALPEAYRGNLFLADFGKRQIMRIEVAREGATYAARRREDLFPDPPADFRPVGIALSPDGLSLYICDWQHRDTKAKVEVGRLLKLTYTGPSQAAPKPRWFVAAASGKTFSASDSELVGALSHPAHSVRLTAQRELSRRPRTAEDLVALVRDEAAPAQARVHAIWALDAIDQGASALEDILRGAESPNAAVARQAIRQLATRRRTAAVPRLHWQLNAPEASVRFQAATALGRIGDSQSVQPLLSALDETDLFARFAAFTALNRIGRRAPESWPRIASGLKSANLAVREGTEFALRETYDERLVAALGEVIRARDAEDAARAAALSLAASLHRQFTPWRGEWWAYHPALAPPPQKSVDWAGTARVLALLEEALGDSSRSVRAAAIDGLQLARATNLTARLRAMYGEESDIEIRTRLIETLGAFRDPGAADLVARALRSAEREPALISAAIRAAPLIGGEVVKRALTGLLDEFGIAPETAREAIAALGTLRVTEAVGVIANCAAGSDGETKLAAIEALRGIGNELAREAIVKFLDDRSMAVRKKAIAALGSFKDQAYVPVLLRAYEERETRAAAIAALAQVPEVRALDALLEGLAAKDPALRESARKGLSKIRDEALPKLRTWRARLPDEILRELEVIYRDHPQAKAEKFFEPSRVLEPSDYERYALQHTGDAGRGRQLFFDPAGVGCAKCHVAAGQGTSVGPDLSSIGAQYDRAQLIESLLYPSKVMREGYAQTMIETKDEASYSGILKAETADQLTLQDAEGQLRVFAKSEIRQRRLSQMSLMPEGLHAGLSLQEFADLLAFLESLKGAAESKRSPQIQP